MKLIRIFLSICEPYFIFNNDPWHNAAVTRPAASHVSCVGSLRPEFPGCSWPWLSQAAAWTRGIVAKCEETIRHRTLVHEAPVSQIILFVSTILIWTEKNGKAALDKNDDHLFKAPTVHYNLHQQLYRHDDQMLHVQFCSIHSWHDSWLRCWSGLSRVSRPGPGMSSNKSLVEVRWRILDDSSRCLVISISPALTPDGDHCCSARWGDNKIAASQQHFSFTSFNQCHHGCF